jgi:hypothetical protein
MNGQKLRTMELLKQLTEVSHETTNALFSLCVNPDGLWKLYIIKSKIIIIGTFEEVATATITEIKSHRELLPLSTKRHRYGADRKYRYMGKPKWAKILIPQEVAAELDGSVYGKKLKYAKSIGFPNFTECLASLGKAAFDSGFKHFKLQTTI